MEELKQRMDAVAEVVGDVERRSLCMGGCGAGAGVADASRGRRLRHLGHG